MERNVITGIAHDRNEALVTLVDLPDRPGVVAAVFGPLAEANINVDMIVQSVRSAGDESDLAFTVPNASLAHAVAELKKVQGEVGFKEILTNMDIAKISAVGVGMRSNAGIAAKMFQTLAERGINILAITTSEIKVSVLIPEEYTELAVRVLHTAYGLDAERERGGVSGEGMIAEARAVHGDAGMIRLKELMARGTEFLGTEWAILGGAMSWISERHLVSAISNAGGFGVIACGAMSPELLDAEIAGTKERTDKPFGVNLITMHPQLSELIDVCAQASRSAMSCSPAGFRRAARSSGSRAMAPS